MKKEETPTSMASALDCAVRDANKCGAGYKIEDVTYCNYMTNEDWDNFLKKMDEANKDHKKQYGGNELNERKVRGGKMVPPKMSSFGSSSRFIYNLSKDIVDFKFEEKLETRVGGKSNMDGYRQKGSEYIYVEAKMHEIYEGSHEKISKVYMPVYGHIKDNCKDFGFTVNEKDNKVTFRIKGKDVEYFDMKQLICHFLGITYYMANKQIKDANVKFLYLLYNPEEVEDFLDKKYKNKVLERYRDVSGFIKENIDNGVINSIFQAVLDYQINQIKKQGLDKIEIKFEMKLVNQSNYKDEF